MSYCINPKCQNRQNPDSVEHCQACGCSLIINERYRLIKPLRELDERSPTEIFEVDNWGTPKVLKVLTSNRRRMIELFQQEAQILQRLKHSGIPKVDTYFTYSLFSSSSGKELHCLVMEKIAGQNLAQWLEENGPITEAIAIDWLRQLVKILDQVHKEHLLHRDIKPSNIILRPNGQLVLIDFGTVREVTRTYVEKLASHDVTRVYSPGYTAPEQMNGQAVPQSDFFALGRTFIHLLTYTYPADLPTDPQTNHLIWRHRAPQISALLAHLLDQLIAPLPQNRPIHTQIILDYLTAPKIPHPTAFPGASRSTTLLTNTSRRSFQLVLLASVIFTSLLMGVRHLGMLQRLELQAFDQLQKLRPAENLDPRLLVVTITEADIRAQKQRRGSLSDQALAQLLKKLEQYQPRAIGLDIYRDYPVEPAYRDLVTSLRRNRHLIAVCKGTDSKLDPDGVPPPPEVPLERLGFSDFVEDSDGVLRRHLLALTPSPASPCAASYAFSVLLAFHYLAAEGILPKFTANGNLQLGNIVFNRLQARTGGYQQVDARGNQILLNYRSSYSTESIAAHVTLNQVLNNQINPNLVKNRIILVGVTATSFSDDWYTPYNAGSSEKMPGVFIQAQMVSQILSAVLDQRPLLSAWSFGSEGFWIWGWSLLGGMLAGYVRSPLILGLGGGAALGLLSWLCFSLFLQGSWVPLVPPVIALVATGAIVKIFIVIRVNNGK